jgi:hypothetical protein
MSRVLWMCSGVLALELLTQCAARSAGTDGAATPKEAVAGYNAAVHAENAERVARFMTPDSRRELVVNTLTEITNVLQAVSPGRGPQGRAAVEAATETLRPFGLDGVLTMAPRAIAHDRRVNEALDAQNTVALIAALFKGLALIGSKLFDSDPTERPMHDIPIQLTSAIRVSGDHAAADAGDETVRFERLDGRWYVAHCPIWYLPRHPGRSTKARP